MNVIRTCPSRFARPVFLWAVTATVIEVAVEWLSSHGVHLPAPRLVTLLPVVPAMFFMLALVRAIQKMDEMQKRICLESVFIAFMLTLVLTFIFAGLEGAGIYRPPWAEVGSLMMFLWACAYIYSSWRYR